MHGNKRGKRPGACGCIEIGHEGYTVMAGVGTGVRHQDIRDQVSVFRYQVVRHQTSVLIPDS
jgi:hypothetical protein